MRFEKSSDAAEIAEFKRLIHSIKGGARMVAINDLSNHVHGLETKLAKCAQENRMKDFVRFALPWIDLLRNYVVALRDDQPTEAASARVAQGLESFT